MNVNTFIGVFLSTLVRKNVHLSFQVSPIVFLPAWPGLCLIDNGPPLLEKAKIRESSADTGFCNPIYRRKSIPGQQYGQIA